MDIKQAAKDTVASAKFEGFSLDVSAVDSRLQVTAHIKGSIDLPGDADSVVANIVGLLGLGKHSDSSQAG